MLCPVDQTELRPVERQGVELDYCPRCRGVWLDRGELDKIVDRTADGLGRGPAARPAEPPDRDEAHDRRWAGHPYDREPGRRGDDAYPRGYEHGPRRKRRESWLENLFDFD